VKTGTRLVRLRVPRLAFSSWASLASYVEERLGECRAPRLFLSREDFEVVKSAECERDANAARAFFRARVGPYCGPLIPRGIVIYERHLGHAAAGAR
jgi:hypothetical protein